MKHFLLILIAFGSVGCFAQQYDAINNDANYKLRQLDVQCKENMTEWCQTQYALIQRQREQELNDLEARRHAFGRAMQEMSHRPSRRAQCTTQVIGNFAYTDCH